MRLPLMALLLGGFTAVVTTVIIQAGLGHRPQFYGILRVNEVTDVVGLRRQLTHGRITHGFQYLDPQKRDWPTTSTPPSASASRSRLSPSPAGASPWWD